MPSCTLRRVQRQAENRALDVYNAGRRGQKLLGIVNTPPCPHALTIHTVCVCHLELQLHASAPERVITFL